MEKARLPTQQSVSNCQEITLACVVRLRSVLLTPVFLSFIIVRWARSELTD
ncbi:hypothetical protein WN943_004640 [Citrus x changshan-huyou]